MRLLVIPLVLGYLGGVFPWSNFIPTNGHIQNTLLGRKPFTRSYFLMGKTATTQNVLTPVETGDHVSLVDRRLNFLDSRPLNYQSSAHRRTIESAPGAYSWGYSWIDEFGNQMFREETADGRGTVNGRYSYRDANGIMRIVEYIADQNGFRTRIRSNEPGIVSSNPANAQIIKFEDENNIPE